MILFITLVILPVLFAKEEVPCASCCPSKPAPDGDAASCSNLSDKIQMLKNAITLSSCGKGTASSSAEDAGVCMTVTMQAIPPCMLKKGSSAQGQCLIEAAKAISKELNAADEASGLEIVKKCKCDAFNKMLSSLVNVKEMICVDDSRNAKNYAQGGHGGHYYHPQHYSANTLWFQYALCQGQVQALPCYFFTNNWNQGDFGQYYLYDNLLGDGAAGGLFGGDNNALALLALSGGLGRVGYQATDTAGADTTKPQRTTGTVPEVDYCAKYGWCDDDGNKRKRRSVMECSGPMDCEDGYSCVGANANKQGECLLV